MQSTSSSRLYFGAQMRKVHLLWRTAICDSVKELGLTEARWLVMVHLEKLGEGCTQQCLANELSIEMPSLTRTLKLLEAQGIIERRVHENDGRAQRLWFSTEGHVYLAKLKPVIAKVRESLFGDIESAKLDIMSEVMTRMEQNAKDIIEQIKLQENK